LENILPFLFLLHLVSNDVKLHKIFFILHLLSNDIKLHTSFQTKLNPIENCTLIFFTLLGSNHVNLGTRFCSKNNARRVLRSPSARAGNAMAKRKKDKSLIYKTLHRKRSFPPQRYIFSQETKIRFLFYGHKIKISNCPSNFYHKFLVENCRAGFIFASFVSIYFVSLKFHHIIYFFFRKKYPKS
jgi:hypothetical protein